MNFNEWFDGKYIKEANLFCKRQLNESFNDGQRNCSCVHTDNTQVILNLENEVKELKQQNQNLIEMLRAEREVRVNDDYLKRVCELEAQNEKLIDFVLSKTECCDVCPITDTCTNSEGTCPYAGILAKGEEEVTREWLMQFISRR